MPVILAIVAILILFYIAYQFYSVACDKGYNEMKYFWICFLLPIVGYMLVIALPDRGEKEQSD